MCQRRQFLRPGRFCFCNVCFALFAACITCGVAQLAHDAICNFRRIAHDTNSNLLGQTNAIRVDINLNNGRVLGPVINAVTWQSGERVEACTERQNNVRAADQLHTGLGAVVAQRACKQWVVARKRIVVLVAHTNRRIEAFSQRHRGSDTAFGQNHTSTIKDNRVLCVRQNFSCLCDRVFTARGPLKFDRIRDFDVDHLSPEIARNVQLRRARQTLCLRDHARQNFNNTCRVADFFLIGNHVFEQLHLLNFLEATLTDGLVGSLRRDQQ